MACLNDVSSSEYETSSSDSNTLADELDDIQFRLERLERDLERRHHAWVGRLAAPTVAALTGAVVGFFIGRRSRA